MPSARRSRTIAAPADELWDVVSDPHHLPRWWPRVERMEAVDERAFTEVMKTRKGKTVRADFELVHADRERMSVRWDQRLAGTPFAAVLRSSETELTLAPDTSSEPTLDGGSWGGAVTEVTIELRQTLNGQRERGIGGYMVRRAARSTLDEALDGLERISG
jgi:uncharacterized protein YndB with AHSA1/START domain